MARHLPRTELILRENGLWAILERTGSKVNVVETGHVDQALAATDLESWRTSGRLSSTSQAWIKAAGHLRDNVATGKHKHGGARTTRTEILILLRDQGYRCAVSGHLLDPVFDGPWHLSVDRIDSSRGSAQSRAPRRARLRFQAALTSVPATSIGLLTAPRRCCGVWWA